MAPRSARPCGAPGVPLASAGAGGEVACRGTHETRTMRSKPVSPATSKAKPWSALGKSPSSKVCSVPRALLCRVAAAAGCEASTREANSTATTAPISHWLNLSFISEVAPSVTGATTSYAAPMPHRPEGTWTSEATASTVQLISGVAAAALSPRAVKPKPCESGSGPAPSTISKLLPLRTAACADHESSSCTPPPAKVIFTPAPATQWVTAQAALKPPFHVWMTEYIRPSGAHDSSTRARGGGGGSASEAGRPEQVMMGRACMMPPWPIKLKPFCSLGSPLRRKRIVPGCPPPPSTSALVACCAPICRTSPRPPSPSGVQKSSVTTAPARQRAITKEAWKLVPPAHCFSMTSLPPSRQKSGACVKCGCCDCGVSAACSVLATKGVNGGGGGCGRAGGAAPMFQQTRVGHLEVTSKEARPKEKRKPKVLSGPGCAPRPKVKTRDAPSWASSAAWVSLPLS